MSRFISVSRFVLIVGGCIIGLSALPSPVVWAAEGEDVPSPDLPSSTAVGTTTADDADQVVLRALNETTDVDFRDVPLSRAMTELGERHQLRVIVDDRALEDAGVSGDEPVTLTVKGVRLRAAFSLMLGALELDVLIRNGSLIVTTGEVANSAVFPRVYDVSDLLPSAGYIESLKELITRIVAPESWDEVGGPAPIDEVPGGLVIVQTWQLHEKVAGLLAAIRRASEQSPSVEPAGAPVPAAIADALRQPVDWELVDVPLKNVLNDVSNRYGIPVICDLNALEDAGLDPDHLLCTLTLTGVSLGDGLDELLLPTELTWVMRDDVLLVTTKEEADSTCGIMAFGVADLYERFAEHDSETLINAVTTIERESWDEVGGPGSIEEYHNLLVVSQTRPVLARVEQLLDDLRSLPAVVQAPESTEGVLRVYGVQGVSAEQLAAIIPGLVAPDSWAANGGVGTIVGLDALRRPNPPAEEQPKTSAAKTSRFVPQDGPTTQPPTTSRLAQFGGGGSGLIVNINCDGWLFVRQTPAVQKQIDRLLREMGVASRAFGAGGNAGFP